MEAQSRRFEAERQEQEQYQKHLHDQIMNLEEQLDDEREGRRGTSDQQRKAPPLQRQDTYSPDSDDGRSSNYDQGLGLGLRERENGRSVREEATHRESWGSSPQGAIDSEDGALVDKARGYHLIVDIRLPRLWVRTVSAPLRV